MCVCQVFCSSNGLIRRVEVTSRQGKFYVCPISKLIPIVLWRFLGEKSWWDGKIKYLMFKTGLWISPKVAKVLTQKPPIDKKQTHLEFGKVLFVHLQFSMSTFPKGSTFSQLICHLSVWLVSLSVISGACDFFTLFAVFQLGFLFLL